MPIRAYKKHFELANLDGLRSNNFSTRTRECVSNNTLKTKLIVSFLNNFSHGSHRGHANNTLKWLPFGAVRKILNF